MAESFRAVRPAADEHNPYFSLYIDRVPDGDIVETLEKQIPETVEFLRAIPESRADYRYAEGKWSIRQIVGHLSDGERVFQYRAMRFSRLDTTPVPGFDEN
ncbi:MAG TPA: DinB family protein, partial [Gemmatimonadaceae bacterium]|nr:DinB family protein [Gemmatimonadaceae bacterium]